MGKPVGEEEADALTLTFGNRLAATKKKTRNQAVKALRRWLSRNAERLDDVSTLRIWKALFFCMWMSDKPLVQEETAHTLAALVRLVPASQRPGWCQAFFETMVREWMTIDRHRLDKFCFLIGAMLNQILSLCAEARWAPAVCEPFVDMLIDVDVVASTTGSLLIPSTANGLRLQLCDMFVEQLGLVLDARPAEATLDGGNYTCRDIPPGALVRMLRPFIDLMARHDNVLLRQRAIDAVFGELLVRRRPFYSPDGDDDEEEEEEEKPMTNRQKKKKKRRRVIKVGVNAEHMSNVLFTIAADENTADLARSDIYAIQQAFQEAAEQELPSQLDSIYDDPASDGPAFDGPRRQVRPPVAAAADEAETPLRRKKKRRRKSTTEAVANSESGGSPDDDAPPAKRQRRHDADDAGASEASVEAPPSKRKRRRRRSSRAAVDANDDMDATATPSTSALRRSVDGGDSDDGNDGNEAQAGPEFSVAFEPRRSKKKKAQKEKKRRSKAPGDPDDNFEVVPMGARKKKTKGNPFAALDMTDEFADGRTNRPRTKKKGVAGDADDADGFSGNSDMPKKMVGIEVRVVEDDDDDRESMTPRQRRKKKKSKHQGDPVVIDMTGSFRTPDGSARGKPRSARRRAKSEAKKKRRQAAAASESPSTPVQGRGRTEEVATQQPAGGSARKAARKKSSKGAKGRQVPATEPRRRGGRRRSVVFDLSQNIEQVTTKLSMATPVDIRKTPSQSALKRRPEDEAFLQRSLELAKQLNFHAEPTARKSKRIASRRSRR